MSKEKDHLPLTYKNNNLYYISQRELGMKRKLGFEDDIKKKIYGSLDAYISDIPAQRNNANGGIFNLDFSQNGKLLLAACEDASYLIYDAWNQKFLTKVDQAHDKCVNCIRFLDTYSFATCSDDGTIKIWDTRKPKKWTIELRGHSNWVKNIEYSEKEQLLVTSAFDGSICTWDIKNSSENRPYQEKVLSMDGLMRTKLSPDGSKMVIATTAGYLIIVHDLNLRTLATDTKNFRPNLYRLMQTGMQTFPAATKFNYLFSPTRPRNSLEFVDDFVNDAEIISSLQIHPHGWSALSRNMTRDTSGEEWTCVHDIQKRDIKEYEEAFETVNVPALPPGVEEDTEEDPNALPPDVWIGSVSALIHRNYRASPLSGRDLRDIQGLYRLGFLNSGVIGKNPFDVFMSSRPDYEFKIMKTLDRLTHYAEELKCSGLGYIKELCFSTDGRLICSPYGKGVRLLGFNSDIQELAYCVPNEPKQLYTMALYKDYHPDVVLCCKFNPQHYQMVSGCLDGQIVWYKPIL